MAGRLRLGVASLAAILWIAAAPQAARCQTAPAPPSAKPSQPPAHAIPGWFDPASGRFEPETAAATPAAPGSYFNKTYKFTPAFKFTSGKAKDYGSIHCFIEVTYQGAFTFTFTPQRGTAIADQDYDPGGKITPIAVPFQINSSESNPRIQVYLQCTGNDGKNNPHTWMKTIESPINSIPTALNETVTF